MKKLDTSHTKNYGPLRLFEADLEDIFTELNACKESELVADDTQYDSVKEFFSINQIKIPRFVRVSGKEPYVTIELSPSVARLYVGSSDVTAMGVFARLDKLLTRYERKPRFIYKTHWMLASMLSVFIINKSSISNSFIYLVPLHIAINTAWVIWAEYIKITSYSKVIPNKNSENFWQRNRDGLFIAAISALFSSIITKLADII